MRIQFALGLCRIDDGKLRVRASSRGNAQQAAKATNAQELTNLLDGKIRAEWQAIKAKDQKAYGDLLTEGFVGVEADAQGERYKWKH